jgi:hypothetical protein
MNNQEFSLYDSVERVLTRWWIVVALMVVGGLVGLGFHLILPPVYEARAVITINLDFAKRELTQFEEDTAFNAASAIITSPSVMNLVIADAQVKGYSITPSQFLRDFYLEGRQSVWELRVRDRDPNAASALTNIWAKESTDALNGALAHALQADQILAQVAGLENCLVGVTPQVGAPQLDCKGLSQDMLQAMLNDQNAALVKEKDSSLGIISIMTIALTGLAGVPETPVLYGQAGLVLAGVFIGLLVSLWVVNSLKVSRHV